MYYFFLQGKHALVQSHVECKGLVKAHIDSFNYMINHELKNIMKANNKITINGDSKFYLEIKDIRVGTPQYPEGQFNDWNVMTPHECRLRDMTYAAPITVDVEYTKADQRLNRKDVHIGRMPIMLRSSNCVLLNKNELEMATMNECPYDTGGYFIVKGQEKVILMQEQLSKNRILVEIDNKKRINCMVQSSTSDIKVRTSIFMDKHDIIRVEQSGLVENIPVSIFFIAMGIPDDYSMMCMVGHSLKYELILQKTNIHAYKNKILTQTQALQYIGDHMVVRPNKFGKLNNWRKPVDKARDYLAKTFLAHVPVRKFNFREKYIYLAIMVRRLIDAQDDPKMVDDKDYYGNKRVEIAGTLVALLFEDLFKNLIDNVRLQLEKACKGRGRIDAVDAVVVLERSKNSMTAGLENAISTGNWILGRFRMRRTGVTEAVSRQSHVSAVGHMTRLKSMAEKSRLISGPRSIQCSQWGLICIADTPEGEQCGLVKNLALLASITTEVSEKAVTRVLGLIGVLPIRYMLYEYFTHSQWYLVFVNGKIVGGTQAPEKVCLFV